MKVSLSDNPKVVTVSLSRRNLTHLLKALNRASPLVEPYLVRSMDPDEGPVLYVLAQEDDEHYGDRKPGRGFEGLIEHDRKVPQLVDEEAP